MNFDDLIAAIRDINGCPEGFLPLHAPVFSGKEREYVLDTLDSTFVSSVGEYVNRFEEMLRDITGAAHAVACVNGTAALQVALTLAGVKPGDLVITQALSFVATANSICHAGAEPVFLDVEKQTLGLSPEAVRSFLESECRHAGGAVCQHVASGRRIAACVPMHTFGFPCRIAELRDLCVEWGIPLVEDAAEALGSTCGGKHCGTFGLLGTLSFNGNKIVTTGGGGAILTDDPELGRLAKHLTTTAKRPHRWEFYHDSIAWNYRMPNLNAALGCAQLEKLKDFVLHKRQLAVRYAELFAGSGLEFLCEAEGTYSNYWLCTILARNKDQRNLFLETSNNAGVMTRPAWERLDTLPAFTKLYRDELTETAWLADRIINIPSGVFNSAL